MQGRILSQISHSNRLNGLRFTLPLFFSSSSNSRADTDDPLYSGVPKPRRDKSERKPYPTPIKVLIRRAKEEREARKAQPVRLLEHPPANGLLVPELVPVAHQVYRARQSLLAGLSKLRQVIPIQRCSALDGVVNLWQLQSKGSGASFLSSIDCVSPKQRRWPEDIAWHPLGNSLFCAYTADSGDSQILVLNLNKTDGGMINSIIFLPWENACFLTGGSDHTVIFWSERDAENSWKPEALQRNMHSSAVMGVAGLQQKQIVLSAGADKRIIGFDAGVGRADFKHEIESKCMTVLPKQCDFNLFMVQTGTPGRQLRLFDIRLRQTEIHAFGWKQESSDSQSALIGLVS